MRMSEHGKKLIVVFFLTVLLFLGCGFLFVEIYGKKSIWISVICSLYTFGMNLQSITWILDIKSCCEVHTHTQGESMAKWALFSLSFGFNTALALFKFTRALGFIIYTFAYLVIVGLFYLGYRCYKEYKSTQKLDLGESLILKFPA